jgi:hypothetical protein
MIPALIVSAVLGAGYGALGARLNRVTTADERGLWVGAGLVGGPLALLEYCGLIWLKNLVPGLALPVVPSALVMVTVFGALGAALTPALDESGSPGRWAASAGIKWARSPVATTAGLLAALATRLRGRPVDFRRGMLFIDVGPGGGALALGAVAWCQNRCFGGQRCITDPLARHEAVHSRTVAAVGELGFYLTYLTAGVLWAWIQGGPWNSLNPQGCGQPFEKTAHTYTSDPATTRRCRRGRVSGASGTATPAGPDRR